MGTPPIACVILTERGNTLYLSKLAVDPPARGTGLARTLVNVAGMRARAQGLSALEVQTRVELTETRAMFGALGFEVTARTAHPGFDRPTSLTLRKPV